MTSILSRHLLCLMLALASWLHAQHFALDGATGHIFHADPAKRQFVLLKATEFAPQSDVGQSRFTVHWTGQTTITNVAPPSRASGIKGPVRTPITATELASGFWKATIHGAYEADRFVITRMEVTALDDPRKSDDPALPRVLVIGDSISMNYHEAARAALKGIANYHRNEGNSMSSTHGAVNTELWLGDYQQPGAHWDVIQFNHGLHDLKQPYDAKTDSFGDYAVALDDYKKNLEKQIATLRKTGAQLIWCTTTPIPNENKGPYARRKGANEVFNAAALEVMKKYPDILINDLARVVEESSVFDKWRTTNDVHFYQKEEQRVLGEAVAAAVRKALSAQTSSAAQPNRSTPEP